MRSRGHTPLPSLRLWLQSTILLAVVAGYSTLYAFSSVLMNDERANRHRLVSMLQRELRLGTIALPLPSGFAEAQWLNGADVQPPTLVVNGDGTTWMVSFKAPSW